MTLRGCITAIALVATPACERARPTEAPVDGRLSGPDDADADYPPGCSELGPATCAGPCQSGDAAACLHLAEAHATGFAVERDPERALALMRKSCELGLGRGCGYLAAAIGQGDPAKSRTLAMQGCELGYGGACVWLVGHHVVTGTPPDWPAAAPWLERGCASGHGRACLLWGDLLRTGQGTTKDDAAAKVAYRTSCDAGEDAACQLAEGTPTEPVFHQLSADDPPADALRRTRQRGHFAVTMKLCVQADGSATVESMEGATGALADVVRTTVSGWRWAPTGASVPPCTKMTLDLRLE